MSLVIKWPLLLLSLVFLGCYSFANASVIVDDHWNNGARTNPPGTLTSPYSTTYSENGVDQDSSGDLSSAWFVNGTGATMTASAGQMVLTPGGGSTGSSSYLGATYFTPGPSSVVTLANPGDSLTVSWTFKTGAFVVANDTSQRMYYVLANTTAVARPTADGAGTPNGAFHGYAILANMSAPLGNSSPFQLREWFGGSGALAGTSGNWTAESPNINDGTNSNSGYAANTSYTMTWILTRGASNDLVVDVTMAGGNLNGTGSLHVNFDDPTPNSFSYDTFAIRGNSGSTTTDSITTTNFKVTVVPEPCSFLLLGLGAFAFSALRRK